MGPCSATGLRKAKGGRGETGTSTAHAQLYWRGGGAGASPPGFCGGASKPPILYGRTSEGPCLLLVRVPPSPPSVDAGAPWSRPSLDPLNSGHVAHTFVRSENGSETSRVCGPPRPTQPIPGFLRVFGPGRLSVSGEGQER